jgi:hypothetical protein
LTAVIIATIYTANTIFGTSYAYSVRLLFSVGGEVEIRDTWRFDANANGNVITRSTINQQLSIGGSVFGKIFIITNLPVGGAGLPPGTVYRNGNQLMIAT